MTNRRVDIDDDALEAARSALGTVTVSETVDEALRLVAATRIDRVARAFDVLANASLDDRAVPWR